MTTPIKTGICSYGMSGKLFHAPFIDNHPGYELTAIVERTKNESGERYPRARLYSSVEDMLADKSIQLVIVNTPSYTHYEFVSAALAAGKHVVVEKPMVLLTWEANDLVEQANKKGLLLSVYQNRRYDGDYLAVKNIIELELLGALREVEIRYDRYRPVFGGKQHKEGNLPGAGNIYDLSPHLVDQAIQLFGFPKALFADLIKMRDDVAVPDYFELLFYYDQLRVRLKATCIARESYYAYILHGMKGSFLQQRSDLQEQELLAGKIPSIDNWCLPPARPDGLLHTEVNGKIVRKEMTSTPGNYMGYYDDLYKALTGEGPNPVPGADGVKNTRIIEAALESMQEGKVVLLK